MWKNYSKPLKKKAYLFLNWNPIYFINKFGQNVFVKKKKGKHKKQAIGIIDIYMKYSIPSLFQSYYEPPYLRQFAINNKNTLLTRFKIKKYSIAIILVHLVYLESMLHC